MNAGVPVIVAEGLTRRFGDFVAVDRLDLNIFSGEVVGFLGPNGAGKSTTIRMLCGLLLPSAGKARVAGYDIRTEAGSVREHIGYMSQRFSLYNDMTVRENLRFFAGMYRVARTERAQRMTFAIRMAGLEGRENALVRTLAGGWKQRLALGCAILHRPPVLFLDEPTSGVEPEARRRFWDLIHDMAAQGVTTLVSTHYMDEAEYCNRIALIDRGRLVALGSPRELRAHELGGTLYALRCQPLGAALQLTQAQPGVVEAAIFSDRLHVVLAPPGPERASITADELVTRLRQAGLDADQAQPVSPSLEDVFIRLVSPQRQNRDHP